MEASSDWLRPKITAITVMNDRPKLGATNGSGGRILSHKSKETKSKLSQNRPVTSASHSVGSTNRVQTNVHVVVV